MICFRENEERIFSLLMLTIGFLSHVCAFILFMQLRIHFEYLESKWTLPFCILISISLFFSFLLGFKISPDKKHLFLLLIILIFFLAGYPLGPDIKIEMLLGINIIAMSILTFNDFYGEKIALIISVITIFFQKPFSLWNNMIPGPSTGNRLLLFIILLFFVTVLSLLRRLLNTIEHERNINQKYNIVLDELSGSSFNYASISRQNRQKVIMDEKKYITREIHDIISYTMTNQLMLIQAALSIEDKSSPIVLELLEKAKNEVNSSMEKTRSALGELREQEPAPEDFNILVDSLLNKFSKFSKINIKIKKHKLFSHLSEHTNEVLFHLLQQCMINTYLHSDADLIEVVFDYCDLNLNISVRDNGSLKMNYKEGIGIKGMRERVESIGGIFNISYSKKGFLVQADIPYNKGLTID